jgi:hypothetical protein
MRAMRRARALFSARMASAGALAQRVTTTGGAIDVSASAHAAPSPPPTVTSNSIVPAF